MKPYYTDEWVTLYNGDCRDVMPHLGTVDLVLTDPPYPREFLPLYGALAKESRSVLKTGGLLAAMCGPIYMPELLALMGEHLTYHWMIAYLTPGAQAAQIWPRKAMSFWKPVLLYSNEKYDGKW